MFSLLMTIVDCRFSIGRIDRLFDGRIEERLVNKIVVRRDGRGCLRSGYSHAIFDNG
jgi:hypothetical protein